MRIETCEHELAVAIGHLQRHQRGRQLPTGKVEQDAFAEPLAGAERIGQHDRYHAGLAGAGEADDQGEMDVTDGGERQGGFRL